jgi:hypothetical protein
VGGASDLGPAGRGLSWLTGAPATAGVAFRASAAAGLQRGPRAATKAQFWLILGAGPRGLAFCPRPGVPTFAIGGLHARPVRGWRVLPGPSGCPRLGAFALGAALAAYKAALARR